MIHTAPLVTGPHRLFHIHVNTMLLLAGKITEGSSCDGAERLSEWRLGFTLGPGCGTSRMHQEKACTSLSL